MKRVWMAGVAAGLLVAGGAAAEDRGWYAKGFGGLSGLRGDSFDLGGTLSGKPDVSYSTGPIVGGALGFAYGRNLAAEVEYAYRSGDAEDFGGGTGRSGDYASTSVMVNGIYTFDGFANGLRPYLGIGIGAATEIDFDIAGGSAAGQYSDTWILAGQGIAGLAYDVTPNWRLSGEVRYFDAGTPRLDGADGARLEARYNTLDVVLGLAYRF